MTWAKVLETGSGRIDARIEIEGLRAEYVTSQAMAQTAADGRVRRAGLGLDGIGFEEDAKIAYGEIESTGFTSRIVDEQYTDAVTADFTLAPSGTRYLTANVTDVATTIVLDTATGITAGDVVFLGTETILVGAVTSTDLTGCTRAHWGSIAQYHYAGDGTRPPQQVHLGAPRTIGKRRVRVWVYGAGDDPLGDGTLFTNGRLASEPALGSDASTWSLTVDHHTIALDEDIGGGNGVPGSARGIYYPHNAPLVMRTQAGTGTAYLAFVSGFFETQYDFVAEVNSVLASSSFVTNSSFVSITAVVRSDGRWGFDIVTPGAFDSSYFIAQSPIDGACAMTGAGGTWATNATIEAHWAAGTWEPPGARTVPRGSFGGLPDETDYAPWEALTPLPLLNDAPSARIHVTNVTPPVSAVTIEFSEDVVFDQIGDWASGYFSFPFSTNTPIVFTSATPPIMKYRRAFSTGGLASFRDALVANSTQYANVGSSPFITADDWAEFPEATEAERGIGYVSNRNYMTGAAISLGEFLAHECRLRGLFPHTDATGKLTVSRVRLPSASEKVDHSIGEDDILADRGFPRWTRNGDGVITSWHLATGYDVNEDEHTGPRFEVENVSARASNQATNVLEIMPRSTPVEESDYISQYDDVVRLAEPVLGVFGSEYATLSLDVPLTKFGVLIGDLVAVTSGSVPNPVTGRRGISDARALVVGRRWDLKAGRGSLRLMVPLQPLAGWAPSWVITAQVDLGGDSWELTVSRSLGDLDFVAAESTTADHFPIDSFVRVYQWDDATPIIVTGVVVGIDTSKITITFDATWTPGVTDWIVEYDDAVNGAIAAQQVFAYSGEIDGFVDFASGDLRAKAVSP